MSSRDRFLKDQKILRLATIDSKGVPHIVPVWYLYSGKKETAKTNGKKKTAKTSQKSLKNEYFEVFSLNIQHKPCCRYIPFMYGVYVFVLRISIRYIDKT